MPRNDYSKLVRKSERVQIALREEEMAKLARSLGRKESDAPPVPTADKDKERRRIRREQERRHKPERFRDTNQP